MKKATTFAAIVATALLVAAAGAQADGAAVFPDGSELPQSGAAFLCLPGQPDAAQDQTSGVVVVDGELYSIGDDSGQIFHFSLDPPYMKRFDAMQVPPWRVGMDLEDLTYIAETGEFAASLETGDTRVRIVKERDGKLEPSYSFALRVPPLYTAESNVGPEGLAWDGDASVLIVGWEGGDLRRYLSFYRLTIEQGRVKRAKFLRHLDMSTGPISISGLFYDAATKTLLVLDRNSDALYVYPQWDTEAVVAQKSKEYEGPAPIVVRFRDIEDPLHRQFQYHSFEGAALDDMGSLWVVTDPWRSADRSKYRLADGTIDEYYYKFVPQIVWFDGFRDQLAEALASRNLGL
jgi:uncharacterized protein YjiK